MGETEFLKKLEDRFSVFPEDKRKEKTEEYLQAYRALLKEGKTEEEAAAILQKRLDIPSPDTVKKEEDEYGRVNHPKKPLLTGVLYFIAAVFVVAGGLLINHFLNG